MAATSSQVALGYFLRERRNIVKDIKEFLIAMLKYCLSITEMIKNRKLSKVVVDTITVQMNRNLHSMIKSLSLLHGLYGYPDKTSENVTGNVEGELLRGISTF